MAKKKKTQKTLKQRSKRFFAEHLQTTLVRRTMTKQMKEVGIRTMTKVAEAWRTRTKMKKRGTARMTKMKTVRRGCSINHRLGEARDHQGQLLLLLPPPLSYLVWHAYVPCSLVLFARVRTLHFQAHALDRGNKEAEQCVRVKCCARDRAASEHSKSKQITACSID
jgi:hypothetical protein